MTNITGGSGHEPPEATGDGAMVTATEGTVNLGPRSISVGQPPTATTENDAPTQSMTRDPPDFSNLIDLPDAFEGLDPNVQLELGQQLKAIFDEIASEPIPDKLLELLAALEEDEKRR